MVFVRRDASLRKRSDDSKHAVQLPVQGSPPFDYGKRLVDGNNELAGKIHQELWHRCFLDLGNEG